MTLILSNDDVEQLLTMADLIPALEEAYVELVEGRGGNRLRSDIVTPTPLRDDGLYALKSMDGVVPKFEIGAVRINSDILTFPTTGNEMRRVKAPSAPGNRYVGLVLLFSTRTTEPLIICPDGVMQRMRVERHQCHRVQIHGEEGREMRGHPGLGLAGRRPAIGARCGARAG